MIDSKISRRYAKALLSLGQEDGHYKDYGQNLQEFSSFCADNNEFFQVVSNQIFSLEDRKKILEAVLQKSLFSDITKNFLSLLLDKNRIEVVQEITDYYIELTDEISNITRAVIVTAKPVKKEALDNLTNALKQLTSKEVKTEVDQDESLIGGVVVRLGDLVLDGSIKSQLERLKESLKRGVYN
ncbi:MAG: ATP synthase F1 subunit delta [Thermodesulfobacteriota bacterium]|nr:ATP synthase F1 subunit delta [Thermodesulfobacteriota bacterium]